MTKSYIPLPPKLAFTPRDLILLRNKNLGLRLTHHVNEYEQGGYGDAIPLSALAGALDIIRFVAHALEYEKKPTEETYAALKAIYGKYHATDRAEDICLPKLLLSYGERCGIPNTNNKINRKNRVTLPKDEEQLLIELHQKSKDSLENIVESLPVFSNLLSDNFNEKLAQRLHLNYNAFATSFDMDYLLLSYKEDP